MDVLQQELIKAGYTCYTKKADFEAALLAAPLDKQRQWVEGSASLVEESVPLYLKVFAASNVSSFYCTWDGDRINVQAF